MSEDNNLLVEEETRWVHELEAAAKEANISFPNKFWLASFAIVAKGDVKKALGRMRNWNRVEEKYRLSEVSMEKLAAFDADEGGAFRQSFLGIGQTRSGLAGHAQRVSRFYPHRIGAEDLRVFMKGALVTLHAACPTLSAVRRGCAVTFLLSDMSLTANICIGHSKQVSSIYQDAAPIKLKKIILIDPPSWVHFLLKMFRMLVKKKIMDRVMLVQTDKITEHYDPTMLPPQLGGTYPLDFWATRSQGYARYLQSVEEVERTL